MHTADALGPIVIGLLLVAIGIANRKGHIGTIHWYHRRRVKEEDMAAFGRLVGLGTIIAGVALALYGVSYTFVQEGIGLALSGVVLAAGVVAGLGLNLYAVFKYNKGLF